MMTPLILAGPTQMTTLIIICVTVFLSLLWIGFARGSYITIEGNKRLFGTVAFIRSRTSDPSNIISIRARATFGGLMTEVYMMYRNPDGTVTDRTLVSKNSLRKDDLPRLLRSIATANPTIDIDRTLLGKSHQR